MKYIDKAQEIRRFLEERFKRCKENIELRCFSENPLKKDGSVIREWHSPLNIGELSDRIHKLDKEKKYLLSVGVHTRANGGGTIDDIREVTCLFADFDPPGKEKSLEFINDSLENLYRFRPHPSIIVLSGKGIHAYWFFKEPISVDQIPNYRDYQKGLAKYFGSDKAVIDLSRCMRVPFTWNLKNMDMEVLEWDTPNNKPITSPCIYETYYHCFKGRNGEVYRYDLCDFDFLLTSTTEKQAVVDTMKKVLVEALPVPNELKTDIVLGWDNRTKKVGDLTVRDDEFYAKYPSHSELDISVIIRLLKWGISIAEIWSIYNDESCLVSKKYLARKEKDPSGADQYLDHQLRNALTWLHDNIKQALISVRTMKNGCGHIQPLHRQIAVAEVVHRNMVLNIESSDKKIESGQFYKTTIGDSIELFYFEKNGRRLYRLESEFFEYFIGNRYGINRQENYFKYLLNDQKQRCAIEGKEIEVYRTAFYDKEQKLLYVNRHDGCMYKVDGSGEVQLVDHGEAEVFFHIEDAHSFEANFNGCEGKLREFFSSKINTDSKAILTHEEQMLLLDIWYYSLFFESLQPTKIINCVIGPQGSGKTFSQKSIGWILYGKNFDEANFPKAQDFDVAAVENYFIVWGNMDKREDWHQDRLARIATGMMLRKRKLYTDLDEIKQPSKCFLGINARTPQFRWVDITERLLIIRVQVIEDSKKISEEDLKQQILSNRNLIWGDILSSLDKIVCALRDEKLDYKSIRMADFARLSRYIGFALGSDVRPLMDKITSEQTDFLMQDNPLIEAIEKFLGENKDGQWFTVGELFEMDSFKQRFRSSASLGIRLRQQRTLLEKQFIVEDKKERNRQYYMFDFLYEPEPRGDRQDAIQKIIDESKNG